MAEENKQEQSVIPSGYNLDAKWDACLDLGVRRFTYFSLIGGFAGLLLFRECFPPPPHKFAFYCLLLWDVSDVYLSCLVLFDFAIGVG